jgi:hypothetical protein
MKGIAFTLALACFAFTSCTKPESQIPDAIVPAVALETPTPIPEEIQPDVPETIAESRGWYPWYTWIDPITKSINEPPLRSVKLKPQDLEVRLWVDNELGNRRGYILRRRADEWTGLTVITNNLDSSHARFTYRSAPMATPPNGFDDLWHQLLEHQVLTLGHCNETREVEDFYVFEIRKGDAYRTYYYSDPAHSQCGGANDVLAIDQLLKQTI